MRLLITGSRTITDTQIVRKVLTLAQERWGEDLFVLHGDARGVDATVNTLCEIMGIAHRRYVAPWAEMGRYAGLHRNLEMINDGAERCVAVWNGTSSGTKHCVEEAHKAGLRVSIFRPDGSWYRYDPENLAGEQGTFDF